MTRPLIKRPTRSSEQSWPWALVGATIGTIALAAAFLGIRALRGSDEPAGPLYLLIVILGFVALVLVIVAFAYSARKRLLQERMGGTMMTWLKSHIYLGGLALVAALAHAFLFPLTGGLSSGKLALVLLALLGISGLGWRIVYLLVPPKVPTDVGNLSVGDTRERLADYQIELEKLRAGKSAALQRAIDEIIIRRTHPAELETSLRDLDESERATWERAKQLAAGLTTETGREARQRRYSRLLQAWRVVHLPLALLLGVTILVHLCSTLNVGRLFQGEEAKSFASADDCASCHSEIVDEWKLSMHRNAQTSSITQAQTLLALDVNPDFEQDCVNCHSPIGSKFSEETTFPLAGDPGLNPSGASTEGITCVVCHAMEDHPGELAGFDDLPVEERGQLTLGTLYGPPLEGDDPLPSSAHNIETGFMTDSVSSSQLCGSCHNVAVDVNGDGLAPADPEGAPQDSNNNGVLDENEFDLAEDLVLQTTFNEWEDFIFAQNGTGPTCIDCHMPAQSDSIADSTIALPAPERVRHQHTFIGVDYELNSEYYSQAGMPAGGLQTVLEQREALLQSAVEMRFNIPPAEGGVLTATVKLKNRTGHSFPTGFAFARQFWLDVSARTSSGRPVCLLGVGDIASPCSSGRVGSAAEDLKACDVQPAAADGSEVILLGASPAEDCDPWLVNFQKILTDGDANGDGVFDEVAYQSIRGGVVKDRLRVAPEPGADRQGLGAIPQRGSRSFAYQFDVTDVGNESVSVRVVLRHRHLPPYFVRALDPFLPGEESAEELLANMTIVDMASNKPLPETATSPAPQSLGR
ncbi:MAG: cytochrome c family protein [Actinomycetota bacterium]|nr:cytochrome c family protein [Actinomycetota bacterium]